jgi:uncharacterized membrane protein YphA (DoxX/SURF4 family)
VSERASPHLVKGYAPIFSIVRRWIDSPQPILRIEIIRILAPLAILGFMSGRLWHADEFLGTSGFHVPDLGHDDYRQPLHVSPLPDGLAFALAVVVVVAGLSVSVGFRTRIAALVFACSMGFIALADRLAAFTVSKISMPLMLAIFLSPAGARYGVDAWRRLRERPSAQPPEEVASGSVRFFQLFIVVMYCASGTAKAREEWLRVPHLLWTHVHDSYQTTFSWVFANAMPNFAWNLFQGVVLALEVGAPIWFAWKRSRPVALVLALGMHAMIGLMFGPVKWFALLMMAVLLGAFTPEALLERLARRLGTRFG